MAIERIAVLTGGGDCPGLNPAIKWVVKTASGYHASHMAGRKLIQVYGIRNGWQGMLEADPDHIIDEPGRDFGRISWMRLLSENEVRPWDRLGGTRLGSSRTNPYSEKKNRSKKSYLKVVYKATEQGLKWCENIEEIYNTLEVY